jgi:cytochrome c
MKKSLLTVAVVFGITLASNAQTPIPPAIEGLLQKHTCLACHKVDTRLVGPAYKDVMKKKKYKPEQIVELIYKPNPKNWEGYPPMAAMSNVPKEDAMKIAKWISTLK